MLPDFPQTRAELEALVRARIKESANERFVIAKLVQGFTQHEGMAHQSPGPDGELRPSNYESVAVAVSLKPEDVRRSNPSELSNHIEQLSEETAQKESKIFYSVLDQDVEQGNTTLGRIIGIPSKEEILAFFERVDWSPDSVFVTHPNDVGPMKALWDECQKDPAFMRRFREAEARKKEEYRARESNRKLVS